MEPIRAIADTWMPLYILHLVELSIFLTIVWAVDRSLRMPTRLRYVLWLIALAKSFVPPVISLPARAAEALPMAGASILSTPAGRPPDTPGHSVWIVLLGIWLASALVLTGAVVWRNVSLQRQLRRGRVLPVKDRAVSRLLVGCPLQVFAASAIRSPVLIGLWQPRLYLPEDWRAWPEAHRKIIISHEANHVQGRDQLALLLQTASVILFGLNPLVWLMHHRLADLRELRCDEAAIAETGVHPVRYSELLYQFIQGQPLQPSHRLTGTCFSETSRAVLRRFAHILKLPELEALPPRLWQYSVLVLVAMAIVPLSLGNAGATFTQQTPRPVSRPPSQRWQLLLPPLREESTSEVYPFFGVEEKPVLLKQSPPRYPAAAQQAGIGGKVFLSFVVDTLGTVTDIRVLRGPEVFRQAAVDALSSFLFRPAQREGRPVAARLSMPVTFTLTRHE
jgi:TonB family protein